MKTCATILLVAALTASSGANASNPVEKVIQLIGDMQTKIIGEGEEAQKTYSKTAEWCEERSKNIGFDLKTAKAEMNSLKATIEEETAKASSLSAKVEELAAGLSTDEADLEAATTIRKKEAADFAKQEKELTEVIDSLNRAIGILEKEMKGGASMLQLQNAQNVVQALEVLVESASLNSADAGKLTALLQSSQESMDLDTDESFGAPAATVYESHSGSIFDTLEGLLQKAGDQLGDARKKETASSHNFEMLKQSLEDEIKFANQDMSKAKKGIAQSRETKSTAQGDLDVTSKDFAGDTSVLSDLHQTCMTKAQDYEAETKSRGEELKALAVAKKAIEDNTAGASGQSYGLNQEASFLQTTRTSLASGMDLANFEAVHFVRNLARKQKSPELAQLASRMASAMRMGGSAGGDPFGKVKGLIADMIEKLESEAQQDATHKAYCDKEMSESTAKNDDKSAEIEKLSTKIDKMTSRSKQLKEEVAGLQKALSELAAATREMDAIRGQEKKDYVANKADMEQGLEGVKMALKVLREYYSKSDKSHGAAEGAGSSVIGLLEVVESDFSKGLAEMTATEETAQASYEKETKENEIEKTTKEQDVKYKTKEATDLEKAVAEATSDRSGVQTELDAVLEYLSSLKKECVEQAETYAERKARFESEISGLREALRILESETVLLEKGSKKSLRGIHKHE